MSSESVNWFGLLQQRSQQLYKYCFYKYTLTNFIRHSSTFCVSMDRDGLSVAKRGNLGNLTTGSSLVPDNAGSKIQVDGPDPGQNGTKRSEGRDFSISDLPNEVLENILSRLSLLEGFKCRPVNSRFRDILDAIPREEIDLKGFPATHRMFGHGAALSTFLRSEGLRLRKFAFNPNQSCRIQTLELLDRFCPGLQVLDCGYHHDLRSFSEAEAQLGLWGKLQELHCRSVSADALSKMMVLERLEARLEVLPPLPDMANDYSESLLERVFNLKFIKEIRLDSLFEIVRIAQRCGMKDRVMRVSIGKVEAYESHWSYRNADLGPVMAAMFPNLESISLVLNSIVGIASLEVLTPVCHKVHSLKLVECWQLRLYDVNKSVLSQMIHIKSLEIKCAHAFDAAFLSGFHELEELCLVNYGNAGVNEILLSLSPRAALTKLEVNDVDLRRVAEFLENRRSSLKKLSMTIYKKTDEAHYANLDAILLSSPKLLELKLGGRNWLDCAFDSILCLRDLKSLVITGSFTKRRVLEFARKRVQLFETSNGAAVQTCPILKVQLSRSCQEWLSAACQQELSVFGLEVED